LTLLDLLKVANAQKIGPRLKPRPSTWATSKARLRVGQTGVTGSAVDKEDSNSRFNTWGQLPTLLFTQDRIGSFMPVIRLVFELFSCLKF